MQQHQIFCAVGCQAICMHYDAGSKFLIFISVLFACSMQKHLTSQQEKSANLEQDRDNLAMKVKQAESVQSVHLLRIKEVGSACQGWTQGGRTQCHSFEQNQRGNMISYAMALNGISCMVLQNGVQCHCIEENQ